MFAMFMCLSAIVQHRRTLNIPCMSAGDSLPRVGHGAGRRKLGGIFVILFVVGFGSRKLVLLSTFDSPRLGRAALSDYLAICALSPVSRHPPI